MITLKEAIKLAKISDREIFYLRKENANKYDAEIFTLKDLRDKYDMKNTMVVSIQPRFLDGDYCGIEFEVKKQ